MIRRAGLSMLPEDAELNTRIRAATMRAIGGTQALLMGAVFAVVRPLAYLFGLDLDGRKYGSNEATGELLTLVTLATGQAAILGVGVQGRGGLTGHKWREALAILLIYLAFNLITLWGVIRVLRALASNRRTVPNPRLYSEATVYFGRWALAAHLFLSIT